MRIFDLFRKKRKVTTKRKKRSRKTPSRRKQAMGKIEADIGNLQSQIGTINIVLDKHNSELQEHRRLINDNSKALNKLEQIVEAVKAGPPASETMLTARLPAMTNPPASVLMLCCYMSLSALLMELRVCIKHWKNCLIWDGQTSEQL